jgi:hypothetical protein
MLGLAEVLSTPESTGDIPNLPAMARAAQYQRA